MGRKTFRGMMALKKHIFIMFMFLIALASLGKMAYNRLASGGTLGAVAAKKFEQQTKQGSGVVSMLVAGRGEFFSGLYCICRKPIVGYGPWAIDWNGLSVEFLRKYGSPEDYELYVKSLIREGERRIAVVPTHSCVVGFWVWYGIFGLLFWIYILYLYWKTITNYFVTYPPWFGCIATILPNAVWDAFFSPYGNRVTMALFFAMCLFLKAVHEKRIPPGGIVGFYQPMEWK